MRAIEWDGREFRLLDQTKLPGRIEYIKTDDYKVIIDAVKRLAVRGAPAIGIAGAFALAFAAAKMRDALSGTEYIKEIERIAGEIENARPTAVNLSWGVRRLVERALSARDDAGIPELLLEEAEKIREEDIRMCLKIGKHGAELMPEEGGVITHCNTGGLATGDHGTAQSVIVTAVERGKLLRVYVDETRPLMQGARLTMLELQQKNIDAVLITDNAAAFIMKQGKARAVITGADRIAANGDTANKIGTYGLAVLARHHNIPFYIAAPTSTIDAGSPDGSAIPVEERDPSEVTQIMGTPIAPEGSPAYAPAFDVTPNELIDAIITEKGVIRRPYADNIKILSVRE